MQTDDEGGYVKASDYDAALSAVTAERDTLREQVKALQSDANSWQSGYDKGRHDGSKHRQSELQQLRAEVEAARNAADWYVPLHEAIQRAAGELPEGWEIRVCVERHGGGVELIGPEGTEDFDTNNERIDYTVIDALEAAMAAKADN